MRTRRYAPSPQGLLSMGRCAATTSVLKQKVPNPMLQITRARARAHTHTRARARARTHARTHGRTDGRTHARTHGRTDGRTTHACVCERETTHIQRSPHTPTPHTHNTHTSTHDTRTMHIRAQNCTYAFTKPHKIHTCIWLFFLEVFWA